MVLTGGRTAQAVYRALNANYVLKDFPETTFYIGDERCLPQTHQESNCCMVIDVLFRGDEFNSFECINGASKNLESEAVSYAEKLPDIVDLLILSVGEDGHIASLFPYSVELDSQQKVELVGNAPKPPQKRITITPVVIQAAKEVVVMAIGAEKGKVLAKSLVRSRDIEELPVRLTIGRTWLLDHKAFMAFKCHAFEDLDICDTKIILVDV